MGSRDKDHGATHHHQPHISSLVIRPSISDGGDGGARGGAGSDYEPGEVRREPPPYSRSGGFRDDPGQRAVMCGYRIHAGSSSPVRRREPDHRHGAELDHFNSPPRNRRFGSGRAPGRFRDPSPPRGRARVGGRPFDRGFDGPRFGPGGFKGDGMGRTNSKVQPREGDWICPDPQCRNLNFARRKYCNNCKRPQFAHGGSPRRAYPSPPPLHAPPRRFPGPPMDVSPGRSINGFRSPPRGWGRDGPREFGAISLPPPRHENRFSDHMRRDRLDYPEDNSGDRGGKLGRPVDWGHRGNGRDGFFNERKGYERRAPSPPPPLPPHRGRWGGDRERSRSPVRGGGPEPKVYRRDTYVERGPDNRHRAGHNRMGDAY